MLRLVSSIAAVAAAAALCGCNMSAAPSNASPEPAAPSSSAAAAPAWPELPAAAACTGKLNDYQKVLTADVASGNLNKSVYDKIEEDLTRAAGACAAGKDADALGIIRATKEKHGYRA